MSTPTNPFQPSETAPRLVTPSVRPPLGGILLLSLAWFEMTMGAVFLLMSAVALLFSGQMIEQVGSAPRLYFGAIGLALFAVSLLLAGLLLRKGEGQRRWLPQLLPLALIAAWLPWRLSL